MPWGRHYASLDVATEMMKAIQQGDDQPKRPAFICTDGKMHVPVETKPTKFLKGSFHCRYCKAPIRTDGSAFYTSQAHFPSTAYWQDHNGIFFCLDADGEHILPHKPLTAEILASTDAILTDSAPAPVEWVDELSENDRRSFERWAGTGCLKVSEDPRVVDRLQNMPPQDF